MKIFSKLYVQFLKKEENKSNNLTYCSSLQLVIVYNFSEIESIFPVPFWDYKTFDGSVMQCPLVSLEKVNTTDFYEKNFSLIGYFFFYTSCILFAVQNILSRQQIFLKSPIYLNNLNRKSISLFPTSMFFWNILEYLLL